MINLRDGQITDLLNNSMAYNPETISIGYAILQEKKRIMGKADKTRLMSWVDSLDETILDYLAVELRTPAYRDSFPIDMKRELIRKTLPFYAQLGTPAAVNWIIQALFGNGSIQEWFEYGGEPHHFRICLIADHTTLPLEEFEQLVRAVYLVKRLSSWLEEIRITMAFPPSSLHVGGGVGAQTWMKVPMEQDTYHFQDTVSVGGSFGSRPEIGVPNEPDAYRFEDAVHIGGSFGSEQEIGIPDEPDTYHFQTALQAGGRISGQVSLPVSEDTAQSLVSAKAHAGGTFSSRTRMPVSEDTVQQTATTILRTGGVCTIISNLSRGD